MKVVMVNTLKLEISKHCVIQVKCAYKFRKSLQNANLKTYFFQDLVKIA